MTGPTGNSEFCFPEIPNVPRGEAVRSNRIFEKTAHENLSPFCETTLSHGVLSSKSFRITRKREEKKKKTERERGKEYTTLCCSDIGVFGKLLKKPMT